MKYPDIKLRPIIGIQQRCCSCRKWFDISPELVDVMVERYAGMAGRSIVTCPRCNVKQSVSPIGEWDHPNAPKDDCAVTFIKFAETTKRSLFDELNAKRLARGIDPLMEFDAMTKAEIEKRIHHIDTMPDHYTCEVHNETGRQVLARLNVLRKRLGEKPIQSPFAIAAMKKSIQAAAHLLLSRVEVKKLKPVIADGAETTRFRTKLHRNKMEEAVKKLDRKNAREKLKSERALAKIIADRHGWTRANVMRWLQTKNPQIVNNALTEAQQAEFKKFIDDRHTALRGDRPVRKSEPKNPNVFTPADIASALKIEPRAVRIFLRKNEKKLKAVWRNKAEGRWAFDIKHKAAVVKFVGGK